MTTFTQEDKDKLEGFIDKYTLSTVLEVLASICYEKAEHIHMNWPDQDSNGQIWHDNGDALAHALLKLED
jgi:hypothetical protein